MDYGPNSYQNYWQRSGAKVHLTNTLMMAVIEIQVPYSNCSLTSPSLSASWLHPDLKLKAAAASLTMESLKEELQALDLKEEYPGWHGYVEFENHPDRKQRIKKWMEKLDFPGAPEFQLVPLPKTNPVLEGVRWKLYHYAMGMAGQGGGGEVLRDVPGKAGSGF